LSSFVKKLPIEDVYRLEEILRKGKVIGQPAAPAARRFGWVVE
jgi:hypothetical protein